MIEVSTIITIITACGGIGIFLLGLSIMTDSLHKITGNKLRSTIISLTKSPYSGAACGTIMTAILQSSSATTVTAVGLVSAGVLTFSESLGIIFGANLGTTITGWIVAIFGFKLKLGILVLPMIFIGMILKLFAKKEIATLGFAIAGFGLIFVGIDTMQEAMQNIQGIITPDNLPNDTVIGRLQLLALGIFFTIITQSSSAGVAITLTILFSGAISFQQAAVLVIGMDVGTTITAILATIGGNINTRRTGFSHMIYNLLTAIGALFLLTPFVSIWEYISNQSIVNNAEIALVAFHSLFNLLGVLIILPFTNVFAIFIKKIISEKKGSYLNDLDEALLKEPSFALNSLVKTLNKEFLDLLIYINTMFSNNIKNKEINLKELQIALDETQSYADKIHLLNKSTKEWEHLISIIHILDHLQRLHERCDEDGDNVNTANKSHELKNIVKELNDNILKIIDKINNNEWQKATKISEDLTNSIQKQSYEYREKIAYEIAQGEIELLNGSTKLEAIKWIKRVSIHINRICYHLEEAIISTQSKYS